MFILEKKFRFEAAHMLPDHDGKCRRLHGHSWVGTLIVEGFRLQTQGPKCGMLVDFGDLSEILKEIVDSHLDHHYLNESTDLHSPTSEELARWIFNQISPRLRNPLSPDKPLLMAVTVEETCTSKATYRPT